MAQITASAVKELRQRTGVGMMDCKKALTEADGDIDAAIDILRKKGAAKAVKKGDRDANEGLIAQNISGDSKSGVLVEVNCETDFVAKNDDFKGYCDGVAKSLNDSPETDLEEGRIAAVQKMGENIKISRSDRWQVDGEGALASYIHTGGKVGVLVEVGTGKGDTPGSDAFKQLVRDITLQIAAASPQSVDRDGLDTAELDKEKEIIREQMKDKPEKALEGIIRGKMEKHFQTCCLIDQGFVKQNGDISVKEHIANVAKEVDDEISVRRFLRYQVGA
ncbi:MAG: translation elongation factor Ts [Verrucomicrobiales bacterium]|nr:translation elongation factor Ts [Verrucomicrobiales bacterium]